MNTGIIYHVSCVMCMNVALLAVVALVDLR